MAVLTVPDWLSKRDGSLTPGLPDVVTLVVVAGRPLYRLEVRPAAGKHTCAVVQTVNGHRLDDGSTYATADAARAGGLDQLRANLGW